MQNTKPRLTIFKNNKAGQPILRNGEPVEYNGKPLIECDLSGKINLPEGLDAGDYEIAIYKQVSKNGLTYYGGAIKPAFKKKEGDGKFNGKKFVAEAQSAHNKAKSNGFAPDDDLDQIPY
jgi:hypothetical protein